MSVEKDIRYELLARLCPNSTGIFCRLLFVFVYSSWLLLAVILCTCF